MITIFQHGKDESAGEIENYLRKNDKPFTIVRLFETREVPANIPSGLVILGGQMSVNDTREYPYFIREKEIIREMVARQKPVFGICLGAQMIASAFGERIFRSVQERGWCRIYGNGPGSTFPFPRACPVFQWHNETFNLPGQATLLLRGDRVTTQAFRIGSAVGVQFHPEVTMQIVTRWSEDLPAREREKLLHDSEYEIAGNKERCETLMEKFLNGWIS